MKKTLLAAIGATLLTFTVQALPTIEGEIHISAFGSSVVIDHTANTVTFSPAAPTANGIVAFTLGDFTPFQGDSVTYENFTYSPLAVANPIWKLTLTPSVNFDLLAVTSITEQLDGGLILFGKGIINMPGYDPTTGDWSFNASKSGTVFSWGSTTTAIPDGGMTVMLLGAALSGLGMIRRKLVA